MRCTIDELMVTTLAASIDDDSVVYVGIGVPICMAAASLAKATHAPGATIFPFAGIEMRRPIMLTLRANEVAVGAVALGHDITEIMNRTEGYGVLEPLAPAQIDAHGNANTIAIGRYDDPKVRLPGFAGADAVGSMPAGNVLYTTRHNRRVLVDRVDVTMTVGAGARSRLGVHAGGPQRLITNLAVFDFDGEDGWRASSLHPGVSWGEVKDNTGFGVGETPPAVTTPEPSLETLHLLRTKVDPFGLRRVEFVTARERPVLLREIMAAERHWLEHPGAQC